MKITRVVGRRGRVGTEGIMAVLIDHISVLDRFARSANLERDVGRPEPLDGYVITARALDVVERIATTAATGPSGGAWSLTGPYGSGKSSLALLLDAVFGPPSPTRELAGRLVDEASPAVGQLVRRAHHRHQTKDSGFHRGLITANREPLGHTVFRALHTAVLRHYGTFPTVNRFRAARTLRGALSDMTTRDPRRTGPSATATVEIARCLAEDAPLLLIIDEFGKNLEAIRDSADADPYLLQQLVEAGQGSGLPIFVLTLQHLSFEDHLASTDGPQRREWAKVQGRFEDVAYVESSHQLRALIGTVFSVEDDKLRNRIARWAQSHARAMRLLGITDLVDPKAVASWYPLHPLAAMILPELCSRYGQHERTLFSFLAGRDTASAMSFLAATRLPSRGQLPSLGLDAVYDYFVAGGTLAAISTSHSSRWVEMALRLRDAHGLSPRQTRLAKAIALLNLVSTSGVIRASSRVLSLVDSDSEATLAGLEAAGIVLYRDFVDEFRIWRGTDVDIRRLLHHARQKVKRQPIIEILSALNQPSPVVAARHSAEHDVLRVFTRRYAVGGEHIEPLNVFSPYDGEALLLASSDQTLPKLADPSAATKPVVVAIPSDLTTLDKIAREVAAVTIVMEDPAVETDWVARRELAERLAETQTALEHAVAATFSAGACRWVLLDSSGETELPAGRGSAALSKAADLSYSSTPVVGNELFNRTAINSHGSKARRLLLKAMIEHGSDTALGLGGHGPEVAMYRAFLERTGLHGRESRNGASAFHTPTNPSLSPAWTTLRNEFERAKERRINLKDIYAALILPPIGMKAAVVPVLVTAGLLAFKHEVAIYEHGTFKPLLTSVLSERMVRNPDHFEFKHFANTTGARRQVVDALAKRLGVRPGFRRHRVTNVLSIVGNLVSRIRILDKYTLRTRNLTAGTIEAREALVAAVEPDALLFDELPRAFGFSPVSTEAKTYGKSDEYAESVAAAVEELAGCHDQLLSDLFEFLLDTGAETKRLAITGQAAALENEVLNPAVRAFVLTLANDGVDTDADWINAVATVVAGKAPSEWNDNDLVRFRHELSSQIAAFQRLVALHAERRRADGSSPFDALRITITRSDGGEHVDLVGIDRYQRQRVDRVLDDVLQDLQGTLGSSHRARKALLAALGERILSEQVGSGDETVLDLPHAKAQRG